nr:ATP synthase F0 subunit 8 [Urodexia penicillum]
MPQMAPMNWFMLFMIFSITFLMFNFMNYFMFIPLMPKSNLMKKIKLNYSLNWKW